jgi:hypothetical protein
VSVLLWGIGGIVVGLALSAGIHELILRAGDRRHARGCLAAFDAHQAMLRAQNPDLWGDR